MAKFLTLAQMQTVFADAMRSIREVMVKEIYEPVKAIADQAKAIADGVRRDADAGKFDGAEGERGEPGPRGDAFTYEDFTSEQLAALKGPKGEDAVVDATLTIEGHAADAAATGDAIRNISAAIETEKTERESADIAIRSDLAKTDRSLDALWKLNEGISYQFETDSADAYSKSVPSGAKAASVGAVGGKTVVWNQYVETPRNETVRQEYGYSIVSIDNGIIQMTPTGTDDYVSFGCISEFKRRSGKKYYIRYSVKSEAWAMESPQAGLPILQGLWIVSAQVDRNTTDWQTKSAIIGGGSADGAGATVFSFRKYAEETNSPVYVRDIVVVDLTLMFGLGNEPTTTDDTRIAWVEQYAAEHPEYNAGEIVSAGVDSVKYNDAVVSGIPEAVRNLPGYGWSAGDVCNSIERTETGWQYVQRVGSRDYQDGDTVTDGTITYYELGAPIITDITELMENALEPFTVEAGGTISFENAAKLEVPNSVEYLVSLAEVGA